MEGEPGEPSRQQDLPAHGLGSGEGWRLEHRGRQFPGIVGLEEDLTGAPGQFWKAFIAMPSKVNAYPLSIVKPAKYDD